MSTAASVTALLGVGVLAGIVSTVASLASIVSYPALLALGLSPVSANVTNTVALMFTGAGAAAGSRPELAGQGRRVLRLGLLTPRRRGGRGHPAAHARSGLRVRGAGADRSRFADSPAAAGPGVTRRRFRERA